MFEIQVRNEDGENGMKKSTIRDISNKRRLGSSEAELIEECLLNELFTCIIRIMFFFLKIFTRHLKTQIKGLEIILAGEEYLDNCYQNFDETDGKSSNEDLCSMILAYAKNQYLE